MAPSVHIPETLNAAESEDTVNARGMKKLPFPGFAGMRYALKRSLVEFWFEHGLDRAATLTFFTVLTASPALLAVYSIATLVLADYSASIVALTDDFVATYIPDQYGKYVTRIVNIIIGSAKSGLVALTIGILMSLISSSAYVRAFSRSANAVYRVSEGRSLIEYHAIMLATTLVMLVGSFGLILSVAINRSLVTGLLEPLSDTLNIQDTVTFLLDGFFPVWDWIRWPIIVLVLMVLIDALYYATPNVRQRRFRWLSTGSAVAIVGVAITGWLLTVYLARFASFNPYGAMGAVIAMMVALWVINAMLLFGFKLDAEIERVRQLRAGIPAERHIQLRPKAVGAAIAEQKIHQNLINKATEIRMKHEDIDTAEFEAMQPDAAETDPAMHVAPPQ
ncbi:YihY/virulence factor BrkB family protein [Corynebacterium sp. H78]|uniref:YihY/virulence factor BrkB family protein n=1 Tax=Corynebacterium sp. H78 TaxID=3133417 RepID=UPI00309AC89D